MNVFGLIAIVLAIAFVIYIIRYYIGDMFIKLFSTTLFSSNNIKVQNEQPHQAKTLVLSCMDYRFINDTIKYLNIHREGDFDYFVLAGSSLGYNESREGSDPSWFKTFEEHVDLAIKLHGITEIIVVDHMDCGYYKAVYGDQVDTPDKEERKHNFNLHKFVRLMKPKYDKLSYKLLLAYFDDNGVIKYKDMNDG